MIKKDICFVDVSLKFARDHALGLMRVSPIKYIRDAKLCGSLFNADDTSGMVSGVNSNFFLDHDELSDALAWFQESLFVTWLMGMNSCS